MSAPSSRPDTRLLIAGRWSDGGNTVPILDKYRLTPCGLLHLAKSKSVPLWPARTRLSSPIG